MINRAAVGALVATDLRSVWRDPMLRWMAVLPVGIAVLLRVGIPLLTQELRTRQGFDLSPYYLLIVSTLVLLMPVMVGTIAGFLLLDLRDDRTLSALQVTPLSVRGYLAYRLLVPMALSLPVTVLMVQFVGQVEIGIGATWSAALAAAPVAPMYALFLGTFARNKVQGFALMKAAGVLMIPPVVAWWVREPWQWMLGIVPYYWPIKLFWNLATDRGAGVVIMSVALSYQALLVWLLLRRTDRLALE